MQISILIYLNNTSKAFPFQEWCFNSVMQISGKWLALLLHHVLFPTSGPSRSGLDSTAEVRSQGCQRALPVVRLPPSLASDVSVHQWLTSPLRTWLIVHLQRGPCSCRPNFLRAAVLFLKSPTCLLSSVDHVSLPSLFTSVCFSSCKLGGEVVLALSHLCHLSFCIWVRVLIQ